MANIFFRYVWIFLFLATSHVTARDLVIHNGPIYTVDNNNPRVEAVAIKNGKIIFAGSKTEALKRVGSRTRTLDLQGKTLIPGLIESHAHLMNLGYSKLNLDLSGVKSYDAVIQMVVEAVSHAEPGEWVKGRGWHQEKWDSAPVPAIDGYPVHDALSAVSPDNPVWLTHASGHAGFANAKAMSIAGINAKSVFSKDGEIIRDGKGQLTGIFTENAAGLISRHIPENTMQSDAKALDLAIKESLSNGITSFHDAGAGSRAINLYRDFLRQGKLDINVWVMLNGRDKELLQEWYDNGPEIDPEGHFTVRAIKLYADGALGSRGAWLLDSYSDQHGHFGNITTPMEYIGQVANDGLKYGFQICTHAIGDRANREVLDQYQKAFTTAPESVENHRFRIEHAQHISEADINRFQKLGIIASMQGIHMASDRPWAIFRLGEERIISGAYVWQKLLQSGAIIINGTDAPVEPINPIASFYASVTRKTLKGEPKGGYEPDQRMSREQALRSYTLDAAYGAFEENIKGSIQVGKRADFTILSDDIMQIPEDRILKTVVEYTIVNGEIKYQSNKNKQKRWKETTIKHLVSRLNDT